ncbi:MAG: hypothetical protein ACREIT_06420 [Tepidisphaeraceae bacterium]
MAMMVLDPLVEKRLKAEREALGLDRHDEVWEGVYMTAPLANNEHQDLQFELGRSEPPMSASLKSGVVPVSFRLIPDTSRPRIEAARRDGIQRWIV